MIEGIHIEDFPLLQRGSPADSLTYLDNAATSLTPQCVIDAMVHYYTEVGANIHRGKHVLSEQASVDFEDARSKVARFIGARPNEIAFVANATQGLNLVADGLCLRPDDLVVTCEDSHHSAQLPFHTANVVRCAMLESGECDLADYARLIERRPKAVVLTSCSNVTGLHLPLPQMCELAKAAGVLVIVDAAQSVSHRPIDVSSIGIDFLCFSGHKMFGPTGIGVLFGRQDALAKLRPRHLGGGTVDWVDEDGFQLRRMPHVLEAGTPHIAGVYGLAAAVDFVEGVGWETLVEHDRALAKSLFERAQERDRIRWVRGGPAGDRSAILSMAIEGSNVDQIARALSDSYSIMCRSGFLCSQIGVQKAFGGPVLRASAQMYNSEQDIESLFYAIDTLSEYL